MEETTVAKGRVGVRLGRPLHLPSLPILGRNTGCSASLALPLKVKVTFYHIPTALPTARRWGGEASNINPSSSLSPGACLRDCREEAPGAINHRPFPRAACPSSRCFTALTPARI